MADTFRDEIAAIRQYAERVRAGNDEQPMDLDDPDFEARLDQTLHELRTRVDEQRSALEQLRATTPSSIPTAPSSDPRHRLLQLRALKTAYDTLTDSPPTLPDPNSSSTLPHLLALHDIHTHIASTKTAAQTARDTLHTQHAALARARRELADAEALTAALRARIAALGTQQAATSRRTAGQRARARVAALRARRERYVAETGRLRGALDGFVVQRLAGMVAAEELGGPVVGELLEVGEEVFGVGFGGRGGVRKGRRREVEDPLRQRRIDEIWGRVERGEEEEEEEEPVRSETEAAAREVRELLQRLMEGLLGEGEEGVYVRLERDSAAARFLVRAKVAVFHPKDARRLRLVDFGAELDD